MVVAAGGPAPTVFGATSHTTTIPSSLTYFGGGAFLPRTSGRLVVVSSMRLIGRRAKENRLGASSPAASTKRSGGSRGAPYRTARLRRRSTTPAGIRGRRLLPPVASAAEGQGRGWFGVGLGEAC